MGATRTVSVHYHHEDGRWWAESADVPEFVAGALTLGETRQLVREGLALTLGEPVRLIEYRMLLEREHTTFLFGPPDWRPRPMHPLVWVCASQPFSVSTTCVHN